MIRNVLSISGLLNLAGSVEHIWNHAGGGLCCLRGCCVVNRSAAPSPRTLAGLSPPWPRIPRDCPLKSLRCHLAGRLTVLREGPDS